MTPSRLRAAGDTHTGLQRDNNEDRFFFDDRHGLFCVIDGVGGHHAGERAAAIAAETLRARLASRDTAAGSAARLREAFVAANEAIFEAASQDRALHGMACVATVAIVNGERLRFGHVGDTRLFKIRDGTIAKLTHDHSPVGELEDAGNLTETEAMRHPRRNEIYRDLGSQSRQKDDADFVELGDAAFERDAALVLCSDGLSDLVSSGSVRRIVESHAGAPALAVQELIAAANDAGGKDNVTAVVVEAEGFADAVATGGRGGARPRGAPAALPPRPAPVVAPPSQKPRWIGRAAIALVLGALLGAAAIVGAQLWGWDPGPLLRIASGASVGPRTYRVGLDPAADFATIGEALERARDGDSVEVGPGEYREALRLPDGVSLIGSRESVLRPPVGAPADWVALTVRRASHGRVSGLLIAPSSDQALGVGVVVEDASIELDDVEVSGASLAGVEFRAGARALLRRSFVHDNLGPGVVVRAQAEPRLEFNVILHNGTRAGSPAPGVLVEAGARPALVANGVGANGGPAVVGWPQAGVAELARQNALSPALVAAPVVPAAPSQRTPPRNRAP